MHSAKQHCAKNYICFPRQPGKHHCPGQMEQTGCICTQPTRGLANPLRQRIAELEMGLFQSGGATTHLQNSKQGGRLLNIGQHLPEEIFMVFLPASQPRLRNQAAKWKWRRQCPALPCHQDLDLLKHGLQRGVVANQMMGQLHHQPAVMSGIVNDINAQQRRVPHVKPECTRMKAFIQLPGCVTSRKIESNLFHRQLGFTLHHLYRLWQTFPQHAGAQDVMAINDNL